MAISFSPAQEVRLEQAAARQGISVDELLVDTAEHIFQVEESHWAAVDRALAQAERGEFIDEEEMDARIEKMLAGR